MALSEHRESLERLEETRPVERVGDAARDELDAALRELEVAAGRERRLRSQVAKLEERLLEADLALVDGEREQVRLLDLIEEIQHTRSWRWTAPFRVLRRMLPF
jgi:hypothetical protein